MQSLCNQYVMRKMSWSVGKVAGVMINAPVCNRLIGQTSRSFCPFVGRDIVISFDLRKTNLLA
jgi:hypothetical protein